MEIRVGARGEHAQEVLRSLHEWFLDDQDIARHAKIDVVEATPEPGAMAGDIETISLIVSSAFNLANLALAYVTWRSSQAAPPAPVEITANGVRIIVEDASDETADRITAALTAPE
ncbi:effector-associated constant component EACC1 [Streptomyces sp. enrichment culture]|uniref:effector-associated constant component EACC1 n=1 Tax=Streptomyces sp. enrichment culture TaxID=1795815 RepID=UPI003F5503C6